MTTIAWIGLGNMGLPMASNLAAADFTVKGVEVNPAAAEAARQAGIEVCGTVAEAVQGAETVFAMLPNDGIVEQVLTGPGGVFSAVPTGT
jgi:3-hydroxyisobutyrate dehydrogenase